MKPSLNGQPKIRADSNADVLEVSGIGITTSIVWRWSVGHAVPNDDFVAHKHRWTGMTVLAADNEVMVLEEMLLEDIQTDPVILAKCHNACPYVPGPLATGSCVFLHMCVDRLAG